jgi:hypothetical protein
MDSELKEVRAQRDELLQKYNALVGDYSALKDSLRVSLVKAFAGLAADMAEIDFSSPNFEKQT